jgi:hypothetical protein
MIPLRRYKFIDTKGRLEVTRIGEGEMRVTV